MRWDRLFDDLEGQLDQELAAEQIDLDAEEERLRLGRLTLRDRLAAAASAGDASDAGVIRLELRGGRQVRLARVTTGRDWIAGDAVREFGAVSSVVIPLEAIAAVVLPPGAEARAPEGEGAPAPLSARLGLAFVLRDLCRRRHPVSVETLDGVWSGTLDRVARDHLDLAEHGADEWRRDRAVTAVRIIPFARITLVSA